MNGPRLHVVNACYPPPVIAIDRESLPSQREPGGELEITFVMVQCVVGVRVYQGCGEPEWVAANGRRCSRHVALLHFPIQSQWPGGWDTS